MNYLISVIVPVYNVEKYLRKCIESILNQVYKNLQIILVDDGSTDQSGEICEEYKLIDKRIEVIHKENGGPASARKAGLALADGQYTGFVDADDYIDSDFYQVLLEDIIGSGADLVHGGYISENNGSAVLNNMYETGTYELTGVQAEFIRIYILKIDSNVHMNHNVFPKLFKTELVRLSDTIVPDFQTRGEDLLLVCSCIMNSKKIFLDKRAGYHYIMRSNSITHCPCIESTIEFGILYKLLIHLFSQFGVLDIVRMELAVYFKDEYLNLLSQVSKGVLIPRYEFADISKIKGKKIVLYGAGKIGQNYYTQICRYDEIKIVAWADKNYSKYHLDYKEVIDKSLILDYDFDLLIIALLDDSVAMAAKEELMGTGIPENKIIWKRPSKILDTEI